MMKKLIPLILLLFAGAAIAAEFSEVDTDQDGTISSEEAQAAGMDLSTADTNQDGQLSQEEFDAAQSQ
jgi:Ca2+-binding EF-hand superfamily protein